MNGLRTPLARARGFGAAGEGTAHWWAQRVTAIALAPLTLWLAASLASLAGAGHEEASAWVARPPVAVALALTLGAAFYHLQLGLRTVIEDYVGGGLRRRVLLLANLFACVAVGAGSVFAVLDVALGG